MHDKLLTLFRLKDDQILKHGKVTTITLIFCAIIFFLISAGAYCYSKIILQPKIESGYDLTREYLTRAISDDPDAVINAIGTSNRSAWESTIGMIDAVVTSNIICGFLMLALAFYNQRARQLVSEKRDLEQRLSEIG